MDAEREHQAWNRSREEGVRGATGNLALVAYHAVTEEPTTVDELPVRVRRVPGEEGVWVESSLPGTSADGPAGTLAIDGSPVEGEAFLARLGGDGRPLLTWGHCTVDAFSLDGTDYELRVYDDRAPNLVDFDGIDVYPYDPDMVLRGHLEATGAIEHVPWEFSRASDTGHTKKVPGRLRVEVAGERRDLVAFLDHSALVLVFADGTTGAESYAPGRFLRMDAPGPDGEVVVDLNRAIVPPCGFSDFYSCPIPPSDNRFTVPIRAGERAVRWRTARY